MTIAATADLINVNGTLYGTTGGGGKHGGNGTVFSVDLNTGTESVVHSFANGADGAFPQAGLIDVKGKFYGTTSLGGNGCSDYGCGTVYMINP